MTDFNSTPEGKTSDEMLRELDESIKNVQNPRFIKLEISEKVAISATTGKPKPTENEPQSKQD